MEQKNSFCSIFLVQIMKVKCLEVDGTRSNVQSLKSLFVSFEEGNTKKKHVMYGKKMYTNS